ncbi:MAG: DUF4340 domain-containing protein [Fibrobacterota bacterium]
MDKSKSVILSGALLIILASLMYFHGNRTRRKSEEIHPLFPSSVTENSAHKIRIEHRDSLLILQKKDDRWYATFQEDSAFKGFPVKDGSISELFEKTQRLTDERFVAGSKGAQRRLGVTPEHGKTVRIFTDDDTPDPTFYIGNQGEIWSNSYLRKEGASEIYSVKENIRYVYHCNLNKWRKNTLFGFSADSIDTVSIRHDDGYEVQISREEESQWRIDATDEDPVIRDAENVRPFLQKLAGLKAGEWSYDTEILEYDQTPYRVIEFVLDDGRREAVHILYRHPEGLKFAVTATTVDTPLYFFNTLVQFLDREVLRLVHPEKVDDQDERAPIEDLKKRLGYE